jgi:putative membrane protein
VCDRTVGAAAAHYVGFAGGTDVKRQIVMALIMVAAMAVASCDRKEGEVPVVTVTAVDTTPTSATVATATVVLNAPDTQFVKDAYAALLGATAFARTADGQAANVAVKAYAHLVAMDLERLANELRDVARDKDLTLPSEAEAAIVTANEEMKRMSGKQFDQQFLQNVAGILETLILLFEAESKIVADQDLQEWTNKTLPTLRKHIAEARSVQNTIAKASD